MHEKTCYICEQCNNWYGSKEDLDYHRSRRHKKYNCDQCDNYGYESKEELDDHIRRRHTKYNCDQCDNWYKCRKELEDHRERRHKEYNCDQCDDKYESREKLEVHRKFKDIENATKNFCFCRKGFNTIEELFEHSYIEHSYVYRHIDHN